MADRTKKPKIDLPLPGKLAELPWVVSSRQAAPNPLAARAGDVAYNVRTGADSFRALKHLGAIPDAD
jgi:hypothetical protein